MRTHWEQNWYNVQYKKCVLVVQSCSTLSDPMDCSLPDSFIHGIVQARVLEWVAIAFSLVNQFMPCPQWLCHSFKGFALLLSCLSTDKRKRGKENNVMILKLAIQKLFIYYYLIEASRVAQVVKNLPAKQETRFNPWVKKVLWRREWQLTPVFLPGELRGQRSLAGYSPGGTKSWT